MERRIAIIKYNKKEKNALLISELIPPAS